MIKIKKIWQKNSLIFPILCLLFTTIASINLLKLPVYLDEGIYLYWSYLFSKNPDFAYVSLQDGKTPLFMWIVAAFHNFTQNFLFSSRFLSVLACTATLICWLVIIRQISSKKGAFLFWLLFASCPFIYLVGRMGFVDSLMTAFISLSLMFLVLAKIKLDKNLFGMFLILSTLSGIALGLGFMTKTTTKLFLYTELLILGFWLVEYLIKKEFKKAIVLLVGILAIFGFYNELVNFIRVGGYRNWDLIRSREGYYIYTVPQVIGFIRKWDAVGMVISWLVHAPFLFQYSIIYLGGTLLFYILGIIQIIKHHKPYLWLVFYSLFSLAVIFLSGRQIASRYFFPVVPSILAISVFGFLYLIKFKSWTKKLSIALIILLAIQSSWMIFNPLHALYAYDDESYFVSTDLSALGLPDVIHTLKPNSQNTVVGVSGIWGVAEASRVILEENGIDAIKIDPVIQESTPKQNRCTEKKVLSNNKCLNLNTDPLASSPKPNKYLYLAEEYDINSIKKIYPISIVKEYVRPITHRKTYLLKLVCCMK